MCKRTRKTADNSLCDLNEMKWDEMKWKNLLVSVVFSFIKKTDWGHYLLNKTTYLNEVESQFLE